MIFAACMDLFTMRISNRIPIALAAAYLPVASLSDLPFFSLQVESIAMHYACGLFMLLITFTIYAFRKIGAGDAKLAAASAIWIGWGSLMDYMVVASLLGGLIALILVAGRMVALPPAAMKQAWIARLHEPKGPLPFGVALGAGAVIVYPQTPNALYSCDDVRKERLL